MNRLPPILAAGMFGLLAALPAAAADIAAVVGWSQRVELGTLVSGVVSEVPVRPGQSVHKDDLLISLDKRGFDSQVSRRIAEQRHALALLEEAKREDERAAELYDRTLLSDYERNQALIGLQSARAAAERARANLLAARLDLEHSQIRAPFDGVVLVVNAAPGQSVVTELQSQPLVTLADNRTYQARAQVDAAQAGLLQAGAPLTATVRGQSFEARVSYVGYEPVAQSGQEPRYELVADIIASEQQTVRVGEPVMLHLD
ncbi:MAG: efflux RND transporter periplasmic adaptor subunit [Chromatiaceae bacterium]|nr:efflux RND transporter periplasmic adaptor subunit [Chromatiaceae bacterium]